MADQPIYLLRFLDVGVEWTYTDSYQFEDFQGKTYTPTLMSVGKVEDNKQEEKQNLEIKLPVSNPFVQSYLKRFVGGQTDVWLYKKVGEETTIVYIGRVANIKPEENEATIIIGSLASEVTRPSGNLPLQLHCTNFLYDDRCGLNPDDFKVEGLIATASGVTLTASEFATEADGYFTGGLLIVNNERTMIEYHVGDTIKVFLPLSFNPTGLSFVAYAGCDRSLDTCQNKFNNILNYFGAPYTPKENPFEKG